MDRVRPILPQDAAAWLAMRCDLLPDEPLDDHHREIEEFFAGRSMLRSVFVSTDPDGTLHGFIEIGLRDYAEGCDSSPVPYVEGWYVAPLARRRGFGRALMQAAEDWSRREGYCELASDVRLTNQVSQSLHRSLGFQEVERAVHYRKNLRVR